MQVSPTTSRQRLKKIAEKASGFVYLIGIEGVTGVKVKKLETTTRLIKTVKVETTVPVIVGFGISKPEYAKTIVAAGADGVAVGSAYAKIYSKNLQTPFQKLPEIAELSRSIKDGCKEGYRKRMSSEIK